MLDIQKVEQALSSPIIGKVNAIGRLAAVMIILFGKQPMVLMTERPKTMNHHAGEIAFPGGTWEKQDGDLLGTAIRETREELGIEMTRSMIIGNLKPVTTLNSGFTILPYVTILDSLPKITPNSEIASILEIPLEPLLNTMEDDRDPAHKSILEMYTFKFQDHLIWGASARMLKQIHDKIL